MRLVTQRATTSPAASRRGLMALSVGVLVLTTVAAAVAPAPRVARAASATTTAALNLRSGPSLGDWVILVMPWGSTVNTLGPTQNGFYQVSYGNTTGWAFGSYLNLGAAAPPPTQAPAPGPSSGTATTTAALNLRSGPSLGDWVILVMPWGATVTLTGQSANGFVSLNYNGTAGWAYSSYLSAASGAVNPPPAPAPSPSPPPAPQPSAAPTPTAGTAITNVNLNFRSGPGTNYPILNVIPYGGTVSLTGISQNGFYNVYYGNQRGWAWAAGLNVGGNAPPPAPSPSPGTTPQTQQDVINIIYAAADRYGQPREDMLRVARCESNLDPRAVNPSGSYGLFQFIPSTWATTPYASYDIYDAWASANATGWMWANGRRGEWVCQ